MADLKMVTERELTQSGYFPLTDAMISDYCPTASDFKNNWKKDGYVIKDVNGREDNELFALSDISAEAKLMLFENDIVFNQGYKDNGTSEGFYVSAATSLTSFSIEMFYDANCTNSTNYSWSLTEDLSNITFTQNGITYRAVLFNGNAPYNNTNNERYLYFKITGYGIGISETDVFKVRQLDYNDVDPTWDLSYHGINFKYNEGPGSRSQFNVTDEANKGWILEYPDFMTLSPTGGTGNATITYYPKSTNETTTLRQGTLYLKSTDDNRSYEDCMVTQDAMPSLTPPSWNLTTGSTFGLSSDGTDVNFTVTDNDHYGYSFSADSSGYFFDIYDNVGTKLDWTTETVDTNDYTLRVNNNTGSSRLGHVYLVYNNQDNTDKIKNEVAVQQNAYVEQPKMDEVYSIYSNGYHSPTQLTYDINSTAITANNITVEIEWAPDKNYKETGFLIPIFGYKGPSETRIYAEYISGDTYRIHLKVRDNDISGATINAAKLTSSNLCTIVHKITNNGKTHSISINNAYGSTTTTNKVATAASFYSIWAGGVRNYSPESNPYSYFGSVKLTVGNIITQWKTWTTDGTICGWISTKDTTQELKTASNYTPGPYKYS